MFGIVFEGHPNLVPLLLPDDMLDHYPLRKDNPLAPLEEWQGEQLGDEDGPRRPHPARLRLRSRSLGGGGVGMTIEQSGRARARHDRPQHQHRAAAPGDARRLPHGAHGRRRRGRRRRAAHRLHAPRRREALREHGLPPGHRLPGPHRVPGAVQRRAVLRAGGREAGGPGAAGARRVHPRHPGGAQPHLEPLHVPRRLRHRPRRLRHGVHLRLPRAREHAGPLRRGVRRPPDVRLLPARRRRLGRAGATSKSACAGCASRR